MDELPESARRLLALARSADEPSAAARERVRHGVAIAIGAGGALAAGTAASRAYASATAGAKLGVGSSAGVKLALVCATVAALGAATWALRPSSAPAAHEGRPPHAMALPQVRTHTQEAPRAPTVQEPQPTVGETEARPEALHPEAAQAQPAVRTPLPSTQRAARAQQPATEQTLRAEMTLLYEASAALDRGDLAHARSLLAAHRARYASGQLRQERRGLEVLTRCVANQAGAEAAAITYMRTAPDAVLSARIASACKLEKTP